MRVKRFVAANMQEAMAKIKVDMGNNAVILHTRSFKEGGFFGLFAKKYVEITAAVDQADAAQTAAAPAMAGPHDSDSNDLELQVQARPLARPAQAAAPARTQVSVKTRAQVSAKAPVQAPDAAQAPAKARTLPPEEPALTRRILTPKAYTINAAAYRASKPEDVQEDIREDIREDDQEYLREDVWEDLREAPDEMLTAEMAGVIAAPPRQSPLEAQTIYQRLIRQGVEEKLAQDVVRSALKKAASLADPTDEDLEELALNQMLKQIKRTRPAKKNKTRKAQLLAFIGPTGVGKTTTIAKLAGLCAMVEQKSVALVTVDTYRIAAVEQLKTIGEIMNVPVKVVFTPEETKDCLGELEDRDLIFLDTAGRSHKNAQQIEELNAFLEQAQPDEVYLVLSGTSKTEDLSDMVRTFKPMRVTALILTKLDETSFFGSVFNVACKSKLPIAYFTMGQSIPDDIEQADPVKLAQMLLKPMER